MNGEVSTYGQTSTPAAIRQRKRAADRFARGLCLSCPAQREGADARCFACRLERKIKRIKLAEAKRSKTCE